MGSKSKQEGKENSKKHRRDSSSMADLVMKKKKKHKHDHERHEAPLEVLPKKSKVEEVPVKKFKQDLGSPDPKKRSSEVFEKTPAKMSKVVVPPVHDKSEKKKKKYTESSDSDSSAVSDKKSPIKLPAPNLSSSDSDFDSSEDEKSKKKKKNDFSPQISSERKSILSSDKILGHTKKKQIVLDPEVSSDEDEEEEDDEEEEINEKISLSPQKRENDKVENVIKKPEEIEECKVTAESGFEGWTKSDLFDLIKRMEAAIPKNDGLKYNSRVEKLDWEQVKFNDYTASECKDKWKLIEKKLRGYRLLNELLSDAKVWVEKPWTDFYRSSKKNRHPDLPKRPLTSYMLFYLQKKEKYAKKNPGLEMTRLSKIVAEKYKNLSEKKREKYNHMALNMREEYKEKMQKFMHDHPTEALKISKNSLAIKKDQGMPGPIKPAAPSKLFLEDKIKHHKSDPNFNLAQFTLECRNKWKNMSNKKKMPWIRWAHDRELAYLDEVKLYKSENPSFDVPAIKSVLSKEEKIILARMEGKPEKPPHSAYSLFSRTMLKDEQLRNKFSTPKERLQEIARLWKEVPKADKDMYVEEVKRLIENYKMEYATYLDSLSEDRREEELASNIPKRRLKVEPPIVETKDKLKQTKIQDLFKKPASSEKEKDSLKKLDFLSREPPQPPSEPFLLFCQKYKKSKPNREFDEKRARKAWKLLDDKEREEYEIKLEDMKQQYFIDYREFLTSLKPAELKSYSDCKGNPGNKKVEESDSNSEAESDSEEDEDEDDDDDDETPALKTKEENYKQLPVDSSSSSSSDESEVF